MRDVIYGRPRTFNFRFVKATMNVIDVLGVLPYFLSLGLSIVNRSNGIRYEQTFNKVICYIINIFMIYTL